MISTPVQSLVTSVAMTQPTHRPLIPGYMVVIICSLAVQPFNIPRTFHLEHYTTKSFKITGYLGIGVLFLSYPLLGYIADVCLTRYRTLKCSFIFLIAGSITLLLSSLIIIIITLFQIFPTKETLYEDQNNITLTGISIAVIMAITGVGLFEANAIQFGLDQLLEAPTPKLIAFIHWYYWTQNMVQLVMLYLIAGFPPVEKATIPMSQFEDQFVSANILLMIAIILSLAAVCLFNTSS